jgi:hypothetical protein
MEGHCIPSLTTLTLRWFATTLDGECVDAEDDEGRAQLFAFLTRCPPTTQVHIRFGFSSFHLILYVFLKKTE